MNLISSVLILLAIACNTSDEKRSTGKALSKFHQSILGQWGTPSKGRPTFDITEDSIYHYGNNTTLPYTIENNDLIITENGLRSRYYNVQVINNDTLVFETPPGSSIAAIRFKEKFPH